MVIPIEMENFGANFAKYKIEKSVIEKCNRDNGDADVFNIENSHGKVDGCSKGYLYVHFK